MMSCIAWTPDQGSSAAGIGQGSVHSCTANPQRLIVRPCVARVLGKPGPGNLAGHLQTIYIYLKCCQSACRGHSKLYTKVEAGSRT